MLEEFWDLVVYVEKRNMFFYVEKRNSVVEKRLIIVASNMKYILWDWIIFFWFIVSYID